MRLDKVPLPMAILRKKLRFVREKMGKQGIDIWITFSREGNEDPLAQDLRFSDLTWRSAAIIEQNGSKTAIVGNLDVEAVEESRFYDRVYGYGSEGAVPRLRQFVNRNKPSKIAVNTSYDEGAADGLTSGMEQYLKKALGNYSRRLVSAEDLAIALRARLVPEELELVRRAIRECEKIYDQLGNSIKAGKKDKDIHDYAHRLMKEKKLETAWASESCPAVNVGNNPASHLGYRNIRIRNGDFVKLDFGVKYQGYCSDIQRVYFVGPGKIPPSVDKMFRTARDANDTALGKLRPGVRGYEVDKAARSLIVRRHYPEYKHALGHVLGRSTHEIGPLLGPRWPNRYGKSVEKLVEKDMVFTIEPSVIGRYGTCNIEQDVITTWNGYEELSKPQNEIIRTG